MRGLKACLYKKYYLQNSYLARCTDFILKVFLEVIFYPWNMTSSYNCSFYILKNLKTYFIENACIFKRMRFFCIKKYKYKKLCSGRSPPVFMNYKKLIKI